MNPLLILLLPALALAQGTATQQEYVDSSGKTFLIYDNGGQQVIYFDDGASSMFAADSAGGNSHVSYEALQHRPFCNQNIRGDCIQEYNGKPETCTYYTRCKREGGK